jgi:RNA polymerase sigma-70 factor (sigma-E family)
VAAVTKPGFDDFVAARSATLLRMAYLLTQDSQLAEDLVQTALAKAWFAWGRVVGDPGPYVRRIMVNAYVSGWRRRWNGEQPTDQLPELGYSDPPDTTDLRAALRRLAKGQRAVIVLRYFEDLTEAETAQVLGCSVGAVKSQTSRALAKLRVDPALEATR